MGKRNRPAPPPEAPGLIRAAQALPDTETRLVVVIEDGRATYHYRGHPGHLGTAVGMLLNEHPAIKAAVRAILVRAEAETVEALWNKATEMETA